jgi:hypothetical protein
MKISDLAGSMGFTRWLIAFILIVTNTVSKNGLLYLWMNLIGSGLAAFASFLIHYRPFTVLETSWMIASFFRRWKYFVKMKIFPKSA